MFTHRLAHYAILLSAMAVLTLPNLGKHSLWDVDEGVNAEAAREMLESGNWIVPHFNFELRSAKPVLLYWLQTASYALFGVNEFAARLPSVLAGMATVLLVYELARRMSGPGAGLLAGLVLASSLEFCMLAHAATPDSTLLFFTVLTFYSFWIGSRDGRRWWFVPAGMAAGLAVLTKGPIGVAMPAAVIFFFLFWNGDLRKLLDRRLAWGVLAFVLVAAPWYALVTAETRGAWIKAFIGRENITRFMQPMENHRGPIYYHLVALLVLFAPWSIFLGTTIWHAARSARRTSEEVNDDRPASRFLICWLATYLIFFSFAATKLPNYVLPVYPALAILTARFLTDWRLGRIVLPRWLDAGVIAGMGLVGVVTAFGIAVASGSIPLPGVKTVFPKLAPWWLIGLIPLAGAAAGAYFLVMQRRDRLTVVFTVVSVAFTAVIAALPVVDLDEYKAPRQLVAQAGVCDPHRDLRLIALHWFQPSVVFYSRREVERLQTWDEAADRLAMQAPVYLFVPEPMWNQLAIGRPQTASYRVVARQYDFLKNCDILVVTNQ